MLLNNPSTFRDTYVFWWICFPNGMSMETIFPPHPKKQTISTKKTTATFFGCFNGPFGKEICHIHPIRGAAFSLWPGCRLAWIDGWIGLESWSFQTVDIFPPLLCGRFLHRPSEHLQARRFRPFFFFGGGGVVFFFDLPKIFPEKMFVQQSYSQTATLKMLFWIKSCCFSFHPLTSPEIEDRYPKWRHVWSRRYIFQGRPFYLEIYSWHVPGVHSLFFLHSWLWSARMEDVFSHVIFFVHVWSMPYLYHIARAHILKFVKICIYIYIYTKLHTHIFTYM